MRGHTMRYRTLTIVILTLLTCFTCFTQSSFTGSAAAQLSGIARPFKGLVPGQSTRTDVERVLGQPMDKLSETLYQYQYTAPQNDWYRSCAQVYVQYRQESPVVERIELLCDSNDCRQFMVQPIAATSNSYPLPEAMAYEDKGTDKERRLEYYGKPHYAVQTSILKNGNPISCRLGFYSLELYQAALPKKQ
jgi:hypothetical protein